MVGQPCAWLRIALLLLTFTSLFSPSNHIFCHVTQQKNNHPHGLYKQQTIQHITITMFFSLSNLLHVLAAGAATIPFVAAQNQTKMVTTDQLYGNLVSTVAPAPGYNAEGGSVFTNFVNAVNDGQFFQAHTSTAVYEKPGSEPVQLTYLDWCSDLTYSDLRNSSLMGYAARCLQMPLAGHDDAIAVGAQKTYYFSEGLFGGTLGISAVFVEQLNVFEGQYHSNNDDFIIRYWDDGRKTMSRLAWEGHDEGDMHPNAATSSLSLFGEITWMPVEEVAQLFNLSTDEFTPETFRQVYTDVWIKTHKEEAATDNPYSDAEQEIIEEVKNNTDSSDETTAPAAPGTAEDGGTTNAATPTEEDSASGRKLTSVAARFVSAALRVFGI